jgi:hypothetical protein
MGAFENQCREMDKETLIDMLGRALEENRSLVNALLAALEYVDGKDLRAARVHELADPLLSSPLDLISDARTARGEAERLRAEVELLRARQMWEAEEQRAIERCAHDWCYYSGPYSTGRVCRKCRTRSEP